jgi:hypothetical protein
MRIVLRTCCVCHVVTCFLAQAVVKDSLRAFQFGDGSPLESTHFYVFLLSNYVVSTAESFTLLLPLYKPKH